MKPNIIRRLISGEFDIRPITPSLWRMIDDDLSELERQAEIGKQVEKLWYEDGYIDISSDMGDTLRQALDEQQG